MLKHQTKSEAAYAFLREQILSGALQPGERLTLARLSEDLGVSLMPVREALGRLARDGLVEITPYKDARVTPMSRRDVEDIFSVRAALEAHATELAVQRAGPGLAEPLAAINARFAAAVEAQDFAALGEVNRAFHVRLLETADNDHLTRFLEDAWLRCARYRAGFRLIPGRSTSAIAEHEAIIAAVRAGDAEAAGRAARAHVEEAGRGMADYVDHSPVTELLS